MESGFRRIALAFLLLLVGCGGDSGQQNEVRAGASPDSQSPATTKPAETTTTTTSSGAPTEPVAYTDSGFDPVTNLSGLIVYWSPSETVGRKPSLRYVIEDGSRETQELTPAELQLILPFGAPPAESGVLRGLSPDGDAFATGGTSSPRWPAECLGFSPDIDGDLVLDDCDPIAVDGPTADFDGDGVRNSEDICPAIPNPDQRAYGRNGELGVACDVDDPATDMNIGRLMVITTTVEDQNAVRAAVGLDPIEWPVVQNPTAAVQEWCESFPEVSGDGPTSEQMEAAVEQLQNMPDIYGLNDEQKSEVAELWVEFSGAFQQAEQGTLTDLQRQEFEELQARSTPYSIILNSSDQSCLDR